MRTGRGGRARRLSAPVALLGLLVACQAGLPPDTARPGDAPDPPAEDAPPRPATALALSEPSAAPPSGAVGADQGSPQANPPAWRDGDDCLAILASLDAAAESGSFAPIPPPVGVLLRGRDRPEWFGARGLRIDPDLPLAVHRGHDGGEIAAPCVLLVSEPEEPPQVERRVSGPERVESAYVTDVVREANPDYEAARIRVRQAERRLGGRGDMGPVRTGDPLVDLVGTVIGGLLGSLDAMGAEREFEEAVAALKDTPTRHERPVYRPYRYERSTVHASKRAALPVALVDRERDLMWSARVPSAEEREFHLLEGLHARDRDAAGHGSAGDVRRELELWERAAPEVRLSALIDGLLAAAPPARPAGGLTAVLARLDADAVPAAGEAAVATATPTSTRQARRPPEGEPAADPRLRSVVRVAGRSATGSGFYVAPELVLTNDHITDGARVVDVTLADGTTVPGLVARRDRRRDLALIKVPRPGPPLALDAGATLLQGEGVALHDREVWDFLAEAGL